MKKPLVVFGRPAQWGYDHEGNFARFHHLPIFGLEPMLRDGKKAWDSVGALLDEAMLPAAVEFFRKHQPRAFLFAPMYIKDGSPRELAGVVRFLERLKNSSPSTLFFYWNGNQQGCVDFNVEAFKPFIDVMLTNTDDQREHIQFRAIGLNRVHLFPQFGFDPDEHGRLRGRPPAHDCHFGGSQTFNKSAPRPKYPNSAWRYRFVCRLAEEFDAVVYGKGDWPFPRRPHLVGPDFYDSFTDARVIAGANHWGYRRYYTRRTVYALASGRPYAVKRIPGMEEDFENRKHLVWFDEVEEGVEAVRWLVENPADAVRIGIAGRELALERFSWAAMMRQFENLLRLYL